MKRRDDIERILKEISQLAEDLQKRFGDRGLPGYTLNLYNGFGSDATTPAVEVQAWTNRPRYSYGFRLPITPGLQKLMAEMHNDLGHHPKHQCPICREAHDGYNLNNLPLVALEGLLGEAVEIAAAMKGVEPHVAPQSSLVVHFEIEKNSRGHLAKLYFANVQERFRKRDYSSALFFDSRSGLCLIQAIDDVLDQARQHLERRRSHQCSVCGQTCEGHKH